MRLLIKETRVMSLNYEILGIMMIQEGSFVKATRGRIGQIPISEAYLGPFINALAKTY